MTVVETLGPVSWFVLRSRRAGCPCGRIVMLRSSWLGRWRRWLTRGRIQAVSVAELGRARIAASVLTARLMEAMLQQGPVDSQMEETLLRFFFHDAHSLFVCRKNLFQWIQNQTTLYQAAWQMALHHQCRRVTFVPTDPYAAKLLRCWGETREPHAAAAMEIVEHELLVGVGMMWNTVWSWLVGIGLLASVLLQVGRQGLVRRLPSRRPVRVALHNYHGQSKRPQHARFAEYLVDGRRLRRQDVLLLMSGPKQEQCRQRQQLSPDIAWTRLFGPPVPLPYLLRLLPRLLLVIGSFCRVKGIPHGLLRRRAAGAVRYGISLEVVLHHYAIDVLLSEENAFSHHIVETVVLNHWGARTAWIPYTIVSLDYNMSYLHYDLLPIQGPFLAMRHGKTWSPRMRITPVGILWNDGVQRGEMTTASQPVRAIIAEAHRQQRKLVVAFPASGPIDVDEFLKEQMQRFFNILATLATREPHLQILIKPKANAEFLRACTMLYQQPFRGILEPGMRQGRIRLLDPRGGFTCTAQDLIAVSDAAVSIDQGTVFGSVWVEALLLGKPSYSFTPSEFRRTISVPGLFDEWLFDDEEALVRTLQASLHAAPGACQVSDRLTALFDPYHDGRAMERFREAIVALADGGRPTGSLVSEVMAQESR